MSKNPARLCPAADAPLSFAPIRYHAIRSSLCGGPPISGRRSDEAHFDAIVARMHADRLYWDLVELGARVLEAAERLILQTPVRTLDALHIASALVLHMESGAPLPFATAEARQRKATDHIGLKVVWVT